MPGPGLLGEVVGQPGQPLLGGLQPDHAEPQRLAVERAAEDQDVAAELLGDVVGHPGVGGGGRGQHRDAVGQVGEEGADPAVVGAEVVAPVGDAVGLVDDEQPAGRGQPRQHLVAEAGVVEPLGADQEHVDLAGGDRVLDRLPLLDVGGVDGDRADAGALGGGDLVAHQRQQRRDDHGRPGALARAAAGWPRSRPPTCPSRCAARPATGAGRPPAPRSPSTGRRAGGRRRGPRARAGAPRPARRMSVVAVTRTVYQRRPTAGAPVPQVRSASYHARYGRSGICKVKPVA